MSSIYISYERIQAELAQLKLEVNRGFNQGVVTFKDIFSPAWRTQLIIGSSIYANILYLVLITCRELVGVDYITNNTLQLFISKKGIISLDSANFLLGIAGYVCVFAVYPIIDRK